LAKEGRAEEGRLADADEATAAARRREILFSLIVDGNLEL
jgi:hypothetical protein